MWTFQYKHGDRPLEGFTIQRAAGRGGFGEVYYALSDSGREVALKVVQGYEQIELRGISQCMNLKSPHLVTIFDVKYNELGRPFVVMEFVGGPNLRQMLDDSPAGLGTQKAAFFLREIGKGLTFLHDCGIVHRDLKPANIFFENGYVKIGDYGLSKAISPTQHSGQTVTVGTVHYMAPEVGQGKYDRSIDIYALGAVLYELLTGTVPFVGASPSEILIKHLSADVDMTGIPEPFAGVIKKAMEKNPADRYASVQEMVEAVFGAEHVRMSVSHFSPDDLSMVAGRVAQKMAVVGSADAAATGGSSSSVLRPAVPPPIPTDRMGDFAGRVKFGEEQLRLAAERFGDGMFAWPKSGSPGAANNSPSGLHETLPLRSRNLLGVLTAAGIAVATGILSGANASHDANAIVILVPIFVMCAIAVATAALWIAWRNVVIPYLSHESDTVRRLSVAGIVSGMMIVGAGPFWLALPGRYGSGTWIAILLPLALLNTWQWARSDRKERVALGPAMWIGLIGFILCGIFNGNAILAIGVLAGTCLAVQVVSPWTPKAPDRVGLPGQRAAAGTNFTRGAGAASDSRNQYRAAGFAVSRPGSPKSGSPGSGSAESGSPASGSQVPLLQQLRSTNASAAMPFRPVPRAARYFWLVTFIVLLTVSVMCIVDVSVANIRTSDQPPLIGLAITGGLTSFFGLRRVFTTRFLGWWSYLFKPVLMLLCLNSAMTSTVILSTTRNLRSDDFMLYTFFIVFPSIVALTLMFLPRTIALGPPPLPKINSGRSSPHSRSTALGLSLLWLCGLGGIHRFYVGKIGTGILWLLTGGLFGVGQLVDLILIFTGQFKDGQGRILEDWNQPATASFASTIVPPFTAPMPITDTAKGETPATDAAIGEATTTVQLASEEANAISDGTQVFTAPASEMSPRSRRRAGAITGGLFSVAAAMLVLVTLLFAWSIALKLPTAVMAGLPDSTTAHHIRQVFFGDYPGWASLASRLLWIGATVLAMLSGVMLILARRFTSVAHTIRGVAGFAGLLLAIAVLTKHSFLADNWPTIGDQIHQNAIGPAVDKFLGSFQKSDIVLGLGTCVISVLILSVPYRRVSSEKGIT